MFQHVFWIPLDKFYGLHAIEAPFDPNHGPPFAAVSFCPRLCHDASVGAANRVYGCEWWIPIEYLRVCGGILYRGMWMG